MSGGRGRGRGGCPADNSSEAAYYSILKQGGAETGGVKRKEEEVTADRGQGARLPNEGRRERKWRRRKDGVAAAEDIGGHHTNIPATKKAW